MVSRTVAIAALAVVAVAAIAAAVFYDDLTSLVSYGRVCVPDPSKNKVAIVIVKGGTYDNEEISSHASAYFAAVKKDLGIDAAGLKKFGGTTSSELDSFVDGLYANDGVGYIIMAGDDMPMNYSSDSPYDLLHLTNEKLECVNRDCASWPPGCKDVAISFIVPPFNYPPGADSDGLKAEFIAKVLDTYAGYHDNFDSTIGKYQRSVLYIQDPTRLVGGDLTPRPGFNASVGFEMQKLGYDMPAVFIINNDSARIWEEAKTKHVVLYAHVHGQTGIIGIGLGNETMESEIRKLSNIPGMNLSNVDLHNEFVSGRMYTSLGEWLNFSKEYGLPTLFVESTACESKTLADESSQNIGHCCWPQTFLESGVWAYFAGWGGSGDLIIKMEKRFSDEQTIGLALRRSLTQYSFIFGDILAHMR